MSIFSLLPQGAGRIEPRRTRLARELRQNSPLFSCRIDPTGRFVFAGAQDNAIHRWDLTSGNRVALTGHRSWIRALAFLREPRQLVSGGYDGRLIWWQADADAPRPLRNVEAHRGWVRAVAVSPDGRMIATCGNDHLVKLWSAADGAPVRELSGHTCHVYNAAFHPDGRHLASGELRGVVKQWDIARGAEMRSLDASVLHRYDPTFRADIGGVRGIAFNRDGSLLACAGITDVTNAFAGIGKPVVVLFDWASGKQKFLLRPRENFQGTMWGVVQFSGGVIAACAGGNGGMLWYWKPDAAADVFAFKLPNNARDLDLHPDGRRLAVAFFDGPVRIYDAGPKA